jgi:hypothetical protein
MNGEVRLNALWCYCLMEERDFERVLEFGRVCDAAHGSPYGGRASIDKAESRGKPVTELRKQAGSGEQSKRR